MYHITLLTFMAKCLSTLTHASKEVGKCQDIIHEDQAMSLSKVVGTVCDQTLAMITS